MEKVKNTFVMYAEWGEELQELDMCQRGELITAIYAHISGEEYEIQDALVKGVFISIRRRLSEDSAKYEEKCATNARIAHEREKKKTNEHEQTRTYTNVHERARTCTNVHERARTLHDNDYDNDNDSIDSSVSKETDSPSGEGGASVCKVPADFIAVIDKWNAVVGDGIPKVSTVTPGTTRHSCLTKRLKDYGLNGIIAGIEEIPKSKFLLGKTGKKPFKLNFDWFIAPSNFQKVKDGNYRDSEYRERGDEDYGGGGSSFWDEYERYKAGVESG